ncbi:capsule biosynthesis protein [Novosphingobium huizhouense]|uniref:capsule biosynthesis protein n=1 Tax=Novosphingobium huizhouense TaxID=2866625 RepID=UPI001CD8D1EA|nr:capsular biosynthesis protein [Novosphingobium huizhouense]
MIDGGIKAFRGRRILLLQGPVGPFFTRFAQDLAEAGASVHKINFNAGDWLFYPGGETYRGTMEDWPRWLGHRLAELDIDLVFLFGDCRPIHQAAHRVAQDLNIEVGVFEEGYIRPDFVTLERDGVNANSLMTRTPEEYRRAPDRVIARRSMPHSFWWMVWWGFLYFTIGGFGQVFFPHYRHHRPLTIMEMFPWLLSPLRKQWFKWRQRGVQARLEGEFDKRFFLVPLQVHNDSQVVVHADVGGVEGFIASTIASFARHAPGDCLLVLKHHPMDRGYRNYTRLVRTLAAEAGCPGRVLYIHDQHTPTLIRHCRGVVVINSTVGLTAVGMKCPTKAVGQAVWDMPGLTYQGSLDRFWADAPEAVPDNDLFLKFRDELIATTQINGSFYRKLAPEASATGLIWSAEATSLPRAAVQRRPAAGEAASAAAGIAAGEAASRPPIAALAGR